MRASPIDNGGQGCSKAVMANQSHNRGEPAISSDASLRHPKAVGEPKRRFRKCYAQEESVVYFIECGDGGPIKIGITNNLPKRLGDMQVSNPYPLKVLASICGSEDLESSFHEVLELHRLRGEWFSPSDLSEKLIELVIAGHMPTITDWVWQTSGIAALRPGQYEEILAGVERYRASLLAGEEGL